MGASNSTRIKQLEVEKEAMMKQHADMAKRLAEEQEKSKKQQQIAVDQMAHLMLLLIVGQSGGTKSRSEKGVIDIEGVNYHILELIGEGGFGKVYKAQDPDSDKIVAIKVMRNSPLIQTEVENEIRFLRITKKIRIDPHPIIDYYGCKVTSDTISIALEFAEYDLFTFWFERMSNRDAKEKFAFGLIIIMYTLRALTFLEKLNIIHGDIKPQNLVLVQYGSSITIKLIDFGTIEKMNTMRSVLTVDASKAHTQYFAAPEFMKRDSNRLIARRLHKKSDAWAAGVMFYILFLEKFPWADSSDYENFVNDPRRPDITVPDIGGYQMIIELLLRKDPEARASAKDTLLQVKAHPVLGVLVNALEETMHSTDDVCNLRVPQNLREELANCATGERRAHMMDTMTSTTTTSSTTSSHIRSRVSCRYGQNCYNKNPDHRAKFAHPGERDYNEHHTGRIIPCRYGNKCYRQNNPDHMAKFIH